MATGFDPQRMKSFWHRLGGATCVALGVLLGAASGFLAYWQHGAHGERDIVARGGFLLYMLLPWVIGGSTAVIFGLIALPLRRAGIGWGNVLGTVVVAAGTAAFLEFAPPVFLLERGLSLLPEAFRPGGDFILAAALVAYGLVVVWRVRLSGRLTNVEAVGRLR